MRILHVCSELYPLLKTGGLADVTGALPQALANLGCDSRVLVPGFPAFMQGIHDKHLLIELESKFGAAIIKIYIGTIPHTNIKIYLIDAPELFDRKGNPYADARNQPYGDNYRRFALLGYVAMLIANNLDSSWKPQVVHGHDWHAGLTPAYLKAAELNCKNRLAGSIFTIHNLAYQGSFPSHIFNELELPRQFFDMNGLECYGQVSFIKSGLFFSDKLTTVSPTYAKEIQSTEQGCGLNGLLSSRKYDLHGILNGVDSQVWNPAKDTFIASNYSAKSMAGKLKCKAALQERIGLEVQNDKPLFVVVSRLTDQKGLNLVLSGVSEIIKQGGQIAILGSGDTDIENAFKTLAQANPNRIAVQIGYDEEQAHRIIAGGDVILVPSKFEPCGLTQLYGLIYGTLPLVRHVGGLADTVTDCSLENLADGSANGFVFDAFDVDAFSRAIRRAFALYAKKTEWKRVQKLAMGNQFGWDKAAKQFLALYEQVATFT